jgi:hypothetical protein
MALISKWPVPVKDTIDIGLINEAQSDGYKVEGKEVKGESPFMGVLRCKGFSWFAPGKWSGANEDAWRHDTAMYWSHAGKQFDISTAGKWWATIEKGEMKKIFTVVNENIDEYNRILKEDFVSEEFGDRRQEIVFIGIGIDEEKITSALNDCLLNDNEMTTYRQMLRNYIQKIITTGGSASLFSSVDHLDQ